MSHCIDPGLHCKDNIILILTDFLLVTIRCLKVWDAMFYVNPEQKNWGLMCGLGEWTHTLNSPRDTAVWKFQLNNLEPAVSGWIHFITKPDERLER